MRATSSRLLPKVRLLPAVTVATAMVDADAVGSVEPVIVAATAVAARRAGRRRLQTCRLFRIF